MFIYDILVIDVLLTQCIKEKLLTGSIFSVNFICDFSNIKHLKNALQLFMANKCLNYNTPTIVPGNIFI